MFHFHRWTKWEVTEKGVVTTGDGVNKGSYFVQARRCEKCGYLQQRREIV